MVKSCASLFDLYNVGYKFQLHAAIDNYTKGTLNLNVNTAQSLFTLRKLVLRGGKLIDDLQIQ